MCAGAVSALGKICQACDAAHIAQVALQVCPGPSGVSSPHRPPNSARLFLQVKLWYDKGGHQLIVTILGAKDLPSREDGRPRNPYVKIYFLPDRRYVRVQIYPVCVLQNNFE